MEQEQGATEMQDKKLVNPMFDASDMKIVRFGFSRRRRLPCIWVGGDTCNFPPYRLDVFFRFRGLKCEKKADGNVAISKNGFRFVLTPEYATVFIREFTEWDKHYGLPSSAKDKTILDVGAGCGEPIFYYVLKGCRSFIAVEPDKTCANLLRQNAEENKLNVKIYNEALKKDHLGENYGFMKCDCEGGEALLLEQKIDKPIALEVHGKHLMEKFCKKGFTMVKDFGNGTCIMRNY